MFVDPNSVNPDRYDAVVVGSGFAGFTVAKQLASRGRKALIIETGGRDYDQRIQQQFVSNFGRGHYSGVHWNGHWIRALGGTSKIWGGFCTPMTERNFARWPIGRADLDPYYRIAAGLLRRSTDILDFTAPFLLGFDFQPMSLEEPVRLAESPETYVEAAGADVLLDTTVTGVAPTTDRRGVTAISLATSDQGRMLPIAQRQAVVLAAGGLGNAQILLNSQDGEGAAVGNENDQVGRHLMEHPHFYECARVVVPADFRFPVAPAGFGLALPFLKPDAALYEQTGAVDLSLHFVAAKPNDDDPIERGLRTRMGEGSQVFDLTGRCEMLPDPANRLVLAEGVDPAGLQRLRAMCVVGADTFHALDTNLTALGTALAVKGPGRLRILNDRIYKDVHGGGHIMGATRMGSDPRNSVVNPDCRVHGYQNLFVAGSSVFTSGGYANPTLTLTALAARLGDKIAEAV